MNKNEISSLPDYLFKSKNNRPTSEFEETDPLTEEAKFNCINYTLKTLELLFLSEAEQKERIYSAFMKDLDALNTYINSRPEQYRDQHFWNELAAHEANVRDNFLVYSQKLQNKIDDAFLDPQNIKFEELKNIFRESIYTAKTKYTNSSTKNKKPKSEGGAFYKALLLIAKHQIAPPPWLAKRMMLEFSKNKKLQYYEKRNEEFKKNARFISQLKSLCLDPDNREGIEGLIKEHKIMAEKAKSLREKLAEVHKYNRKNMGIGKIKYIALIKYPDISSIESLRSADYVIRDMKTAYQTNAYGISTLP